MGHPIPAPHASIALQSHGKLDRTLVVVAIAAALALGAGVPILAGGADQVASPIRATPVVQHQPQTQPGVRFDGGPDEGTRGLSAQSALPPGTRFDGGPDEGTRGPAPLQLKERAGGPTMIPQGPGAR